MKYTRMYLAFASAILLSSSIMADGCCGGAYAYNKTHFSQRPQGNFYPMLMMATADKTHIVDTDKHYHVFSVTLGYRQNFDRYYQAQYFLNQNGFFTVGGDEFTDKGNVDMRATDLGLAGSNFVYAVPYFQGSATAQPTIKEFIADFDFYAGFDKWVKGTWFRIHVPVVQSSWNFCLRDATGSEGGPLYPINFFAATEIPPFCFSIKEALGASDIGGLEINAGKVRCQKSRWGVADVHFELGWDFARNKQGNIGLAIIATAPTGLPKPCSSDNQYLFPPSIGAQRSAQLGGALRGQYELFDDSHKSITLYGDMRAVHLFNGKNKRLMSLTANHTTAYNYALLLYPYDATATRLATPAGAAALEHAANILNRNVNVSAALMGEATFMLALAHKTWNGGVGYNFWFRTRERLCLCDKGIASQTQYGNASYFLIKGDRDSIGDPEAYGKYDSNISTLGTSFTGTAANVRANSFTDGDIDTCVATHPATYSNMLFGYLSYTFDNKWVPYIAVGAHIEMGRGNTALNTWGAYLKGGLTF